MVVTYRPLNLWSYDRLAWSRKATSMLFPQQKRTGSKKNKALYALTVIFWRLKKAIATFLR
jgi:hypothetical protein